MSNPIQELAKTRQKVAKYFGAHPGADRLPDALARDLEDRTRDYVAYQISEDKIREGTKGQIKCEVAELIHKYMDSIMDLDFTWIDTTDDKSNRVTGIEIVVSENRELK